MSKTVVVKVKPYPFKAEIKTETATHSAQVMKVTYQGAMVEVVGTAFQPGDKLELRFVTPVLGGVVQTSAVVVKIYNQMVGASQPVAGGEAIRMLELHFRSLPNDSMAAITQFLTSMKPGKGA